MSKSIIIFSSVDGHTREICDYIANNLNGEVVVVSLDASPSLIEYDKIIIGASIRYGKYRKNLFEFIKKNQKIIENKENAFFSVNVVARKNEKNTAKSNPYVSKFLKNTSWVPKKIDFAKALHRSAFLFEGTPLQRSIFRNAAPPQIFCPQPPLKTNEKL